MSRVAAAAAALALAAGACRSPAKPPPAPTASASGESQTDGIDLRRELEATVLEGYSQLSLGNLEAYGDTVAEDVPIVLIETGPRDVVIGDKASISASAFRIEPCVEILSKNLEIHLSEDGSVGWVFDDVSCRVPDPFDGRRASIPLRLTAVYQRYVDSWVLVMQHVSYAWPPPEIVASVRADGRRRAARIEQTIAEDDGIRKRIARTVRGLIADREGLRARKLATDPFALVLWPGPQDEYHGAAIGEMPSLEQVFGPGTAVRVRGAFVGLARNSKLAWVAADLELETQISDDRVVMPLRATYVFERRDHSDSVWTQVQAHVSAPILARELSRRVFGM